MAKGKDEKARQNVRRSPRFTQQSSTRSKRTKVKSNEDPEGANLYSNVRRKLGDMDDEQILSRRKLSTSRFEDEGEDEEEEIRVIEEIDREPIHYPKLNSQQTEQGFNVLYIVVIVFLLVISYIFFQTDYFSRLFVKETTISERDPLEYFQHEFENKFVKKYSQFLPKNSLRVIKKAAELRLKEVSTDPVVILLIGSEKENIASCLANDFALIINEAYNDKLPVSTLNGAKVSWQDIDNKFKDTFEIEKKHIILISNLESLNGNDAMALHQFTDHSNALFPQAIIVVVAFNEKLKILASATFVEMDAVASELLDYSWKDSLKENQRSALISRLTPSVAVVLRADKPEGFTFRC